VIMPRMTERVFARTIGSSGLTIKKNTSMTSTTKRRYENGRALSGRKYFCATVNTSAIAIKKTRIINWGMVRGYHFIKRPSEYLFPS
jgi:hypothetical protein